MADDKYMVDCIQQECWYLYILLVPRRGLANFFDQKNMNQTPKIEIILLKFQNMFSIRAKSISKI